MTSFVAKPITLTSDGASTLAAATGDSPHTIGAPKKRERLPALDFTKGALVLIMVLYHWLNYFVTLDFDVYRYLRFLTPSFIFIAGFLISQLYLRGGQIPGSQVAKRTLVRGIKLLAIVLSLNLGTRSHDVVGWLKHPDLASGANTAISTLIGRIPVSFSVLIPISFLLIVCGGLLVASRHFPGVFHLLSAALVAISIFAEFRGISTGYLQLFSLGMLGVTFGYLPIATINACVSHRIFLVIAYALYVVAIAKWNVIYPLQIVGVCLSLLVLYCIATLVPERNKVGAIIILLGKYSLFGYIIQIVILQVLRKGLRPLGSGILSEALAFLVCLIATTALVDILHRARARVPAIDKTYVAVFG